LTATARHAPAIERVSTLELFFDLVFVFTITQLTAVLAHHPSWEGLAQVVLMLGVIWWMYGGYAWLTNTVRADIGIVRLLLLGGMAGFMVLALVIPTAFSGDGPCSGPPTCWSSRSTPGFFCAPRRPRSPPRSGASSPTTWR